MARPKKIEVPTKERRVTVRMSNDLYNTISKNANAAYMSVSEYLRKLITNNKPVVKYEIVFNDERILKIFSNLGHVGGNLNQIAKHLNQGAYVNDQICQDVRNCISELYIMRDRLRERTGEYRGSN